MMISILQKLLACLLITEFLESGTAFFTRHIFFQPENGRKQYLVLFLVNLFTNPIANLLYFIAYFYAAVPDLFPIWLLIEIGVILLEGWIFRQFHTWFQKPLLFSLVLNSITALAGKLQI